MVSNTRSTSVDVLRAHRRLVRAYEEWHVADFCPDFVEAFNAELDALGCAARVALPKEACHSRSLVMILADGREVGMIPNSVEPIELAAFAEIMRRTCEPRGGGSSGGDVVLSS